MSFIFANHNFHIHTYLSIMNFIILSNLTFVLTLSVFPCTYIDRVVYVRFEKSEYSAAEEDKAVEITVLTDRSVDRPFSVSLRSEHNSTQGKSYSHALC